MFINYSFGRGNVFNVNGSVLALYEFVVYDIAPCSIFIVWKISFFSCNFSSMFRVNYSDVSNFERIFFESNTFTISKLHFISSLFTFPRKK